jgi:FMN phosphatase YigB (HAD superfamily)
LDYLNENYKLHIITNGFAEVQGRKIKNAKLHDYFHTITNSDMAGVKSQTLLFEYALDLAKANKENSIMIGDSLDADVQGALDMGLDAIFFIRIKFKWNKNKTSQSFIRIKKIFIRKQIAVLLFISSFGFHNP